MAERLSVSTRTVRRERLNENPSRWYLTGFLAPALDPLGQDGATDESDNASVQEETETDVTEPANDGAGGAAGDNDRPDAPSTKRRFLPSSVGLTVLLPPDVKEIEAHVSWGDYQTEPPLPEDILIPEDEKNPKGGSEKQKARPRVDWVRKPQTRGVRVAVPDQGRGAPVIVPESAAPQRPGGALVLETHARLFTYATPEGNEQVLALTVFLVNRRVPVHRFYADVAFAFQVRLELVCQEGFRPRRDISGYNATDFDLRVADLHYSNVFEWAVGRNAAAAWDVAEDTASRVTRVWTDPLPQAEVERVAPNQDKDLTDKVTLGMEALAQCAEANGNAVATALAELPALYAEWIDREREKINGDRDILSSNNHARGAFRFMNLAVARAARHRNAGASGDPAANRHRHGVHFSSPLSCSILQACPTGPIRIAKPRTCYFFLQAAAEPKPILDLPRLSSLTVA